ncbi:MAG: TlpA family protein disulfide reductase, partial [Bacteroidales bacterium]|nr:TlpA family protein disulfide reductase [Bacteroidales bacterium]
RMELIEFKKTGNEAKASELEAELEKIYEDGQQFSKDYVTEHPASYISPFVLRSVSYGLSGAEIEAELEKLDAVLSKSAFVIELAERAEILKKVAIGEKFLDFTQNDPDGNPVTLSSLVGENYLLIDFWAAWCGPCRVENPNIVAVYNNYKDKGFDVLGVSLDRDKEAWLKAIEDDNLTWTQVSDLNYWNNEASKAYGVNAIPSNLLLGNDGIIIEKNIRGEELRNKISELLD